ncbi:MAG: phosphoenolpyruvate--protein phosphotransferase [Elusimicrobiota bacterium]
MDKKVKNPNIKEEAKIAGKHRLGMALIEVLSGDRYGTSLERDYLSKLKQECGEDFYSDVIYFLTHVNLREKAKAKKVFDKILDHRKEINRKLGRNVGVQVAAVDYLKNVEKMLKRPTIIEEKKARDIANVAVKDEATKSFDRKMLFHDLDKEINQTRRYGTIFSILFIDVDNLKDINDTYGHLLGDKLLQKVSETLRNNIRSTDDVYRYAGDEFAVLLPKADLMVSEKVASKLVQAVDNIDIETKTQEHVSTTVSIGMASFNNDNIGDTDFILETVDKSLYKAKESGGGTFHSIQWRKGHTPVDEEKKKKIKRVEIGGVVISEGITLGEAFVYRDILSKKLDFYEIKGKDIQKELNRIKKAIEYVQYDIKNMKDNMIKKDDKKYADIFDAHVMILEDPELMKEFERELKKQKVNAEHIVRNVFKRWEHRFKRSQNKVIRQRGDDIVDLSKRILRFLTGGKNVLSDIPPDRIVFSKRLLPSDTVNLKREHVKAIITEKGNKTTHAALLAKGLGIPYIARIDCSIESIKPGSLTIVDTDKEKIIVNPKENEIKKYREKVRNRESQYFRTIKEYKNIELKKQGRRINVFSNVNSKSGIERALEYGCDGIGLYRIEQIYMRRKLPPTEEYLYQKLKRSLERVKRKPAVIRLLDVGGDKILPYLEVEEGEYSYLGLRGIRLLFQNPEMLKEQLKALLRLRKDYNIKILVPMVTIANDVIRVKNYMKECLEELKKEKKEFEDKIPVGAMIETPSSVAKIDDIFENVDFVSIGTNDLIQYTMASGRDNYFVSDYYHEGTEVVLNYIEDITKKADKKKKDCMLCGELASNTHFTEKLLNAGLRNFSVSVSSIPSIKRKIAEIIEKNN